MYRTIPDVRRSPHQVVFDIVSIAWLSKPQQRVVDRGDCAVPAADRVGERPVKPVRCEGPSLG
jgi:hypothetical protein